MSAPPPASRTRLIVRGLPAHATADLLRAHVRDALKRQNGGADGRYASDAAITDARVCRTGEGVSRQFGFVGFRTAGEATRAREYLDGTFFDTARIAVDMARPVGDSQIARPWSRHSIGSAKYAKQQEQFLVKERGREEEHVGGDSKKRKGGGNKEPAAADDAKLREFLDLMDPAERARASGEKGAVQPARKRSKIAASGADDVVGEALPKPKKVKKKRTADGALVIAKEVPNRRRGGEGLTHTLTHVKFAGSSEDEAGSSSDSSSADYDDLPAKAAADSSAAVSDLDWLRSRAKVVRADDGSDGGDSDSDDGSNIGGDTNEKVVNISDADADMGDSTSPTRDIGDDDDSADELVVGAAQTNAGHDADEDALAAASGRILIQNLPFVTVEEDLSTLCAQFGVVAETFIPMEKAGKDLLEPRSRGFGFVSFMEAPSAARAVSKLDGTIFQGRLLRVVPARRARAVTKPTGDSGSHADKQLEKQKQLSGSSHNWNALFLSSDAVAAAAAARLGVTKHELLIDGTGDGSGRSSSGAVRLALAETDIIRETKEFLLENDIDLNALSEAAGPAKGVQQVKRSRTVILVKNLPATTRDQEISSMFSEFGELTRCLLPPAKAIAIVEFVEPHDAKRAFVRLAYSKFKHVPLYLEWAPEGLFSAPPRAKPTTVAASVDKDLSTIPGDDDDSSASKVDTTVFVKNLSWEVTEDELKQFFVAQGLGVRAATLATKRDAITGKKLPIGYGFVEFHSRPDAVAAVAKRNGHVMNGRTLEVSLSQATSAAQRAASEAGAAGRHRSADTSTIGAALAASTEPPRPDLAKLVVRNLPFQATKRDIRQLFAAFGTLQTVRVPQRHDGRARGFAFVEFATAAEASGAMAALAHTHLYGRHLVIEWATTGDAADTQTARDKAAREGGITTKPLSGRKDTSQVQAAPVPIKNPSSRKDNLILPSQAKHKTFD